ncbi:unnamed protein product, partial [Discosporangium mesarthrocarpum]
MRAALSTGRYVSPELPIAGGRDDINGERYDDSGSRGSRGGEDTNIASSTPIPAAMSCLGISPLELLPLVEEGTFEDQESLDWALLDNEAASMGSMRGAGDHHFSSPPPLCEEESHGRSPVTMVKRSPGGDSDGAQSSVGMDDASLTDSLSSSDCGDEEGLLSPDPESDCGD